MHFHHPFILLRWPRPPPCARSPRPARLLALPYRTLAHPARRACLSYCAVLAVLSARPIFMRGGPSAQPPPHYQRVATLMILFSGVSRNNQGGANFLLPLHSFSSSSFFVLKNKGGAQGDFIVYGGLEGVEAPLDPPLDPPLVLLGTGLSTKLYQ